MSEVLRVAFMCLVWAFIMKFQVDYEQDQTTTRYLKDGLELAVHDATMMLDVDELSNGFIVFDQEMSERAFQDSLEKNLQVNLSDSNAFYGQFSPSETSFFKDKVEIVHVEFIDNSTEPATTYPCVYGNSCGEAAYDILETLHGPSMIVVAETTSPRLFSSREAPIRQSVVYEYQK